MAETQESTEVKPSQVAASQNGVGQDGTGVNSEKAKKVLGQAAAHARVAPPCVMVIFGAGGDLTKRLLLPSIYNLARGGLLPDEFAIIGVTHSPTTDEEFRQQLTDDLHKFSKGRIEMSTWKKMSERFFALSGEFEDKHLYEAIKTKLAEVDQTAGTQGNYLFYLATPPEFFSKIVEGLGKVKLQTETDEQWRRVVIEKPFGHDLASAESLNKDIGAILGEKQIYRIDHYLGKETVQNILVFRFANGFFEPIWNRRYIDQVQITVAESIGIEGRGGYYDGAGALRDMMQNHLFQMLSLTAMEPPTSMAANPMRDEKTKVLHAITPLTPEDVLTKAVRGQYGPGIIGGKPVVGYLDEARVAPNSHTETYAALQLYIDNWRWAGVPFYLRTGKYLPKRATEIAVQFKRAPSLLFRDTAVHPLAPNWLIMRIQPDEGISLQFGAKVPGPIVDIGSVDMDFCYSDYFGTAPSIGYETLLYDCMIGDATLFQRADTVEAGWEIVAPVLDVWQALMPRDFPNYAPGTWGPKAADDLLARNGHVWHTLSVEQSAPEHKVTT